MSLSLFRYFRRIFAIEPDTHIGICKSGLSFIGLNFILRRFWLEKNLLIPQNNWIS